MSENKRLERCGSCSHFSVGKWNGSKGSFDNYCNVLGKNVSVIGYACSNFERRAYKKKEWEVTEVIGRI